MSEIFTGQVDVFRTPRPDEIVDPDLGPVSREPQIRLDGDAGDVIVGGPGRDGAVRLLDRLLRETITIDSRFGNIRMGGNGQDGDLLLYAGDGDRDSTGAATIHLDGQAGDIILRNGDCAEDFETADPDEVEPGCVVSLDEEGRLRLSDEPYDRRVAGVVSGAGDCRPGIVLARDPLLTRRVPVALVGRVFCRVDATRQPVSVGDLLTTSRTPGHAMRAANPSRAFGAVIGKAMGVCKEGFGLIPVLVALQ